MLDVPDPQKAGSDFHLVLCDDPQRPAGAPDLDCLFNDFMFAPGGWASTHSALRRARIAQAAGRGARIARQSTEKRAQYAEAGKPAEAAHTW